MAGTVLTTLLRFHAVATVAISILPMGKLRIDEVKQKVGKGRDWEESNIPGFDFCEFWILSFASLFHLFLIVLFFWHPEQTPHLVI